MGKQKEYGDYSKPAKTPSQTGVESPLKTIPAPISPLANHAHGNRKFHSKAMRNILRTLREDSQAVIMRTLNDFNAPGIYTLGMKRLGKGKYQPTSGSHVMMLRVAYNGIVDVVNGFFKLKGSENYTPLVKVSQTTNAYDDELRVAMLNLQRNFNLDNKEGAVGPETLMLIDMIYLIMELEAEPTEDTYNFLSDLYAYFETNVDSKGMDEMVSLVDEMHNKKEQKLKKKSQGYLQEIPSENYDTYLAREKYRRKHRPEYFAIDSDEYVIDQPPSWLKVEHRVYEGVYIIYNKNTGTSVSKITHSVANGYIISQYWPTGTYHQYRSSFKTDAVMEKEYIVQLNTNSMTMKSGTNRDVFRDGDSYENAMGRELPQTRPLPQWFKHFFQVIDGKSIKLKGK